MVIETINEANLIELTNLYIEMFPETNFDEEFEAFKNVLQSNSETCFLVKAENEYVAFMHLSLRSDYVEGSDHQPTAYLEAIFVKEPFRRKGIAQLLLKKAEIWALQNNSSVLASDSEISNQDSIHFHIDAGFEEANRIVCFTKKLHQ